MCETKARIRVRVQPKATSNKVVSLKDNTWYLKIAAPPVKGKANQELIEFLSDLLDISKSQIIIEKGLTGKQKLLIISGLTEELVNARLEKAQTV